MSADQLQPHEQRVVAEHAELADRLQKLSDFMGTKAFQALGHQREKLLERQQQAMKAYLDVLAERIDDFDRPDDWMVVYESTGHVATPDDPLAQRRKTVKKAKRLDRFSGYPHGANKATASVVRRADLPADVELV